MRSFIGIQSTSSGRWPLSSPPIAFLSLAPTPLAGDVKALDQRPADSARVEFGSCVPGPGQIRAGGGPHLEDVRGSSFGQLTGRYFRCFMGCRRTGSVSISTLAIGRTFSSWLRLASVSWKESGKEREQERSNLWMKSLDESLSDALVSCHRIVLCFAVYSDPFVNLPVRVSIHSQFIFRNRDYNWDHIHRIVLCFAVYSDLHIRYGSP